MDKDSVDYKLNDRLACYGLDKVPGLVAAREKNKKKAENMDKDAIRRILDGEEDPKPITFSSDEEFQKEQAMDYEKKMNWTEKQDHKHIKKLFNFERAYNASSEDSDDGH